MNLRTLLTFLIISGVIPSICPAQNAPPSKPDFYATFDHNASAIAGTDNAVAPSLDQGVEYVDGIEGKAVYIGGSGAKASEGPALQYPAQSLLNDSEGTVMFWVRPGWDGSTSPLGDNYRFFYAGPRLNLFMYAWLRCDLGVLKQPSEGKKPDFTSLYSSQRGSWLKDDWWHLALTWKKNGWSKLYVNGLPYTTGFGYRPGPQMTKEAVAWGEIKSFAVGSTFSGDSMEAMRANASFDELKLYKTALDDAAVMEEYRRFMPFDFVLNRRFVRADQDESLALDIWPGGLLSRPRTGRNVPTPIKAGLDLTVLKENGEAVTKQHYDLEIAELKTIRIAVPKLAVGNYRLACQLQYGTSHYRTSYRIYAFQQLPAPVASDDDLKLGDPIVEIDCTKSTPAPLSTEATSVVTGKSTGDYREAGDKRGSRFSYELDLKALGKFDGSPVMLEVYWPDNVARSMGLYLYRKASDQQDRDRLEGGIQSGDEFALSGKMQVTRYLFYPWVDKYLFEARTLVNDYPAAVAKIVVRPVLGRLPKLAINSPDNLPTRYFGHMDEDQSFDALLALDMKGRSELRELKNFEMLLDYMDYTGQNLLAYPFMRYRETLYPLPSETQSGWGKYLYELAGWQDLLLDMFQQRGKKLNIILNIHAMPEGGRLPEQFAALQQENYFQRGRDGGVVKNFGATIRTNPLHPQVREAFFGHIDEILRRYGNHPALLGMDLWSGGPGTEVDWLLMGLKSGYDDLTIGMFEKESGIKLPTEGEDRYGKRYALLTTQYRKEWLEWCASKNTQTIKEVVARVRQRNPKLTLTVTVTGEPMGGSENDLSSQDLNFSKYYHETFGLDLEALKKIDGLIIAPMRYTNAFRWQMHWNGHYSTSDELKSDVSRQSLFRYPSGSRTYCFPAYFESFVKSLKPDVYSCMFENADVKPHGRFFLEEFSQCLTASDPAVLLIGAQPIGVNGRDDESREFIKSFLALPAVEFKDIDKLKDPVCGRMYQAGQATYLSLQNRVNAEVVVNLRGQAGVELKDLGANTVLPLEKGLWSVTLKPFELKALKTNGTVEVLVEGVQVPDDLKSYYADLIKKKQEIVDRLKGYAANTEVYEKTLAGMRKAAAENCFADVHRSVFSKIMRLLPEQIWDAKAGYMKKQKEMIAEGRYAVDCGSSGFYQNREKKLFFPDLKYTPGSYGYLGSHSTSTHTVEKLDSAYDKTLMYTEAYDLESYLFTVPNGTYTVKLHNRIGFEPDAKPGMEVMTLEIQGKRVWDKMDLYLACDRDMNKGAVSVFKNIIVNDGILRIDWIPTDGKRGWCNAIEVYPESSKPE